MSTYYKLGSLVEGLTSTATAAGTTTLTASSRPIQQFTGTTTQTVVLPDATTLSIGRRFDINNRSTGAITVNANGGGAVGVVAAGTQRYFLVSDISLAAGVWRVGGVTGSGGGGGVVDADKLKLLQGMAGLNLQTDNIVAKVIKTNPEEVGGNFWITKSPGTPVGYGGFFSASGFYYQSTGLNPPSVETGITSRYSDDDNYWLARTSAPSARYGPICFSLTDNYVVGGNNANPVTSNQSFNVLTNAWTSNLALPVATDFGGGFALNGYGFIVGGRTTNSLIGVNAVYQYDSVLNSWTLRSPTLATASQRSYTQTADLGGFGYSVGGSDAGNTTNTSIVNVYDIATNSWSTAPSMITTRSFFGISNNVVGSIMAFAGSVPSNSNLSEQFFDTTKTWKATATLGTAKNSMAGGSLNGSAMCVGSSVFAAVVESFIPASFFNLGSVKVSTTAPTSILAAVLMSDLAYSVPVQIRTDGGSWKTFTSGGSVLKTGETLAQKLIKTGLHEIMGGHDSSNGSLAGNYSFNDLSNTWVTKTALATARAQAGSFNVNGVSYIASGASTGNSPDIVSMVSYSDLTGAFTSKNSLSAAQRAPGNYDLLGKGYLIGGDNTSVVLATNNQYNDVTDAFLAKTALPVIKVQAGSFAISDKGYVCNAGTSYSSGQTSTDNYQYDPILDSWASRTALGTVRTATTGMMNRESGYGYIVCGSTAGFDGVGGNVQSLNERFDPALNSWSTMTAATTAREGAGATLSGTGNLVVGGRLAGVTTRSTAAELYNPFSNSWSARAGLPVASRGATQNSSPGNYYNYEVLVGIPAFYAGAGGGVWVTKPGTKVATNNATSMSIGGVPYWIDGTQNFPSDIIKYDEATDTTFIDIKNNTASGYSAAATFTLGGIGYVCGGTNLAGNSASINPLTRVVVAITNLGVNSYPGDSSGCSLNGFGYVHGGDTLGSGPGAMLTNVRQYNPTANSWAARAALSSARTFIAAYTVEGQIITAVGWTSYYVSTAICERYNDASNVRTAITSYPAARARIAKVGTGSSLFLTGGTSDDGTTNFAESHKYLLSLNAWVAAPPFLTVIEGLAGMSLSNNENTLATQQGSAQLYAFVSSIKNAVLGVALEIK